MKPKHIHELSEDESITVKEVFEELVYSPNWFYLDEKIKNVVDIGALIGSFSLWIHEKIPHAKIFAYEPDPESFNYLLKNIQEANAEKHIHANNLAVWEKTTTLSLHRFENKFGNNSVMYKDRPFVGRLQETIEVNTTSLKNIIAEIGKIDLLKIDCEGAEYKILYALNSEDFEKIKYIVLEYHGFDDDKSHRGDALSDFLRKHNFTTQIIPMNTKNNEELGYIYASKIKEDKKFQIIFDQSTINILNLHKMLNAREEYAKDLERTIQIKDSELRGVKEIISQKDNHFKELESVTKQTTSYAKKLESLIEQKTSHEKELEAVIKEKTDQEKKLESVLGFNYKVIERFENIINQQKFEIANLASTINSKELELTATKQKLSEIERSTIFRITRKTGKIIDYCFPANSLRGEFKKTVLTSISVISSRGFKEYLSEVKIKIKRKEFKVLTPIIITEKEEDKFKKIMENNKKNRLKLNPHSIKELTNDEFVINEVTREIK